jgi:hypothetical protein
LEASDKKIHEMRASEFSIPEQGRLVYGNRIKIIYDQKNNAIFPLTGLTSYKQYQ